MGSLQIGNESIHFLLVCEVQVSFVRLSSKRTCRNLFLKVAVILLTDEISSGVGIAHGVASSGIVGVEWQGRVSFSSCSSEGQRTASHLEVTLSQLNSLVSDHLLVNVSASEGFVSNCSA